MVLILNPTKEPLVDDGVKKQKHQLCILNHLSQYHRHQLKGQVDSISTQIKLYHFTIYLIIWPLNISGLVNITTNCITKCQ